MSKAFGSWMFLTWFTRPPGFRPARTSGGSQPPGCGGCRQGELWVRRRLVVQRLQLSKWAVDLLGSLQLPVEGVIGREGGVGLQGAARSRGARTVPRGLALHRPQVIRWTGELLGALELQGLGE